jgi:hypothetical protein
MKLKCILFVFFSSLLLSSCKSKVENEMMGVWVIDEIYYNKQDIKMNLLANAMVIRKNYTCELPIINVNDNHSDKEKGEWKIVNKKSETFFVIKTTNLLFNGTFKIEKVWKEHDNKSQGEFLKIILSSNSLRLQCTRDASDIPI